MKVETVILVKHPFDLFPILGGRLLKRCKRYKERVMKTVSNPWREAIEEIVEEHIKREDFVSNPWREAIEVDLVLTSFLFRKGFQSLEGGY